MSISGGKNSFDHSGINGDKELSRSLYITTVSGDLHVDGEMRVESDIHIGGNLYLHGITIKE